MLGTGGARGPAKATSSGTDWGPIHIVDGSGATSPGAHTSDYFADSLSVIVDGATPPNVHVFYYDQTVEALLEAWSASGADGSWQYSQVDEVNPSGRSAPVLVNGGTTLELYYIANSIPIGGFVYNVLREAQKTSFTGNTWNISAIDGMPGLADKCHSTPIFLQGSVGAVVTPSGNPQVFYADTGSYPESMHVATFQ